jgi:N-acetylglucosaminyl-diphospho-decaprenol L-rhamnosyltransferase
LSGPFQGGDQDPAVAVVIVSYRTRQVLLDCLRLLLPVQIPLEVVVVDNASADGSAEAVRESFRRAVLIESPENVGFARAANRGWAGSSAPYVLFLNPDARATSEAVEAMATIFDTRSDVGILGPRTRNLDGTPQV